MTVLPAKITIAADGSRSVDDDTGRRQKDCAACPEAEFERRPPTHDCVIAHPRTASTTKPGSRPKWMFEKDVPDRVNATRPMCDQ